jgi:hypothetical protein
MLRPHVIAAAAAALLLGAPAVAGAADPIPGATYTGTTDTGSPFSLTVSPDGASVTEILSSAPLTCVGPEGGVEIFAIASSALFPVAGGAISGKDEAPTPRIDALTGTFTSATEVTGKLQAGTSKFTIGEGVTSCMREVAFTAKTTASAPHGGPSVTAHGTAPAVGAPHVTLTGSKSAKLLSALRKGFAVGGTVSAPSKVVATARIAAKDARKLGLGRKAKVVARKSATVAAAGPFGLTLKPAATVARKLRRARTVKVAVTLVATTLGSSASTTSKRTITLRR